MVMSLICGIVGFGFLWMITRKATAGVPSKLQAFAELTFDFVDEQVRGMFHGDRRFIAPLAFLRSSHHC